VQALVLGPLALCVGDDRIPLGTPKQKATLALLVSRPNTVVPVDDIIAELWGERPPASALANARMYAANLRRALAGASGGPRLTKRGAGYELSIDPVEIDVVCFRDLVSRAREGRDPVDAAALFDRALLLWRGRALADVPAGGALRGWCAAVEEERLRAVEDRAEAHIAAGVVDRPTTDLRELLSAEPLRERAYALLMHARYLAGDVEGALVTFDTARRHLADQLGVEPADELWRLQHAILNREPTLAPSNAASNAASAAPPRQLPADVVGFVGRVGPLRELDALVPTDADPGGARVAVITGTAGVGKTAVAVHWAHRVADRFPDGQLHTNLHGFHPDDTVVHPADVMRGFLDALGVLPERMPADLAEQAALYRSRLAGKRILIVLDNARDADQVRPLLPGTPDCLVVVTSRTSLTGLVAVEGARAVALPLPSAAEARDLLARRLGQPRVAAEPAAVQRIIDACARLPIALAIAAAHAAANPGFPLATLADELHDARTGLAALDGGDSSSDVRALFSWSCRALSPPALNLFRLLGLHLAADISRPAAASLAGLPMARVRQLLAELTRHHLLAEDPPGRYGLHDLLYAYAVEQAQASESETWQREARRRILDHYVHSAGAAARLLNPHRDVFVAPVAADGVRPEAYPDGDAAMAWFRTEHPILLATVRQAEQGGNDAHAWHLARSLTTFLLRLGHWRELVQSQQHAVAAAVRLADPAREAHARNDLAIGYAGLGRFSDVETQLARALDLYSAVGDDLGRAKVYGNLAEACDQQGRYRDALSHAHRALDIYVATDHPERQGHALNMVGWCHVRLGEYKAALTYCERAIALFQTEGDRYGQAHAWDSLGHALHELGRHHRAIQCYRQAVDLFRDSGDRLSEADSLVHLGDSHASAGDRNDARDAWQTALTILDEMAHPDAVEVRAKLLRLRRLSPSSCRV
jgi:DNA-binding SARP family transcriptional activator/tetratricopeptide (TPR) repeat protein